MNLGILLQISGIFFVMIGAILALSTLWTSYFERSKRMADLLSSIVEKHDKQNKEKSDETKIQKAEDLLSYVVKDQMSSVNGYFKVRKLIFRLSSIEQRFLVGGIGLIVFGSVLQIIGLVIS